MDRRWILAVTMAMLLACEKKEEPKPAAPTAAPTTPATTAAPTSKPASSGSAAPEKKKATKEDPAKIPATKVKHPVPKDWDKVTDNIKGFAFSVPKGTTGTKESVHGVDVYKGEVPKPHEIGLWVFVYRDKSMTKDDLEKDVKDILAEWKEKDVKIEKREELAANYDIMTLTATDKDNKKFKYAALLGTDLNDNYIMMLASPADKWGANEETIEEIWGSFEMFTGGGDRTK